MNAVGIAKLLSYVPYLLLRERELSYVPYLLLRERERERERERGLNCNTFTSDFD